MAHIITIAFTLFLGYWIVRWLRRLPGAVKNALLIGGGFFVIMGQVGIVAIMVGALATERPSDPWLALGLCASVAIIIIWNAWLALHVAQRFMLMNLHRGLQEHRRQQPATPPYWEANPRVSWKEYRG